MKKALKKFKNEKQERAFWLKNDSTDHIDWSKARHVIFPNLKPTSKSISIRLPESMIEALKNMANKRDVPYQSLIKMLLSDSIQKEFSFFRKHA